MAISELYADAASISTTEYSLTTDSTTPGSITTDGIVQVMLDLSTLTATESYRLRIKEKTQAASTQRLVHDVVFSGVQDEPVYAAPALVMLHGWDVTLQKLQGTDRSIEWSIRSVA